MRLFLFDVDGVLCDTGCTIDEEFRRWFIKWSKNNKYALVTGGERASTLQQIGSDIVNNAYMGFHCMGNQVFIDNREYKLNQFVFGELETNWLNNFAEDSPYTNKTENRFEIRTGSVNFSIIGRNVSYEEKKEYNEWDNKNKERLKLVKQFNSLFPQYEAFIGGNASIDIALRGANKSQCINMFGVPFDQTIFLGDKCAPYGIDYPLYRTGNDNVWIKDGYHQTWEILKTL